MKTAEEKKEIKPFRELGEGEYLKFIKRGEQRDGGFIWKGEPYRGTGDIVVWCDKDDDGNDLGRLWTVAEHVDEYFALKFIAGFESNKK